MAFFSQLTYQPLASPDIGRACLPSVSLHALKANLDALPSGAALTLQLTEPSTGRRTFVGILDFSAADGTIELPRSAAEALGAAPGALLSVRVASPPPAEALTLRPLRGGLHEAAGGFAEAWLSAALPRARSVLVAGEVVELERGGERFPVLVVSVEPGGEAVSLHNTNATLTLEPPAEAEGGSGGGAAAAAAAATADAPPALIQDGPPLRVEVAAGGAQRLVLQLGRGGGVALLQLQQEAGPPLCLAVFVAEVADACADAGGAPAGAPAPALPPPWPCAPMHTWALVGGGGVPLLPAAATLWPGEDAAVAAPAAGAHLRALLQNFGAVAAAAELRLLSTAAAAAAPGGPPLPAPPPPPPLLALFPAPPPAPAPPPVPAPGDGPPCATCRAFIPATAAAVHALSCARVHAPPCSACGAVLRRGAAADAHAHCVQCAAVVPPPLQQLHAALLHGGAAPCPHAGCAAAVAPLAALRAHAARGCPHRRVQCRFCGDAVAHGGAAADAVDTFNGLGAHEAECGSRTRVCTMCVPRRAVRLKQWEEHAITSHGGRTSRASSGSDSMGRAMEEELPLPPPLLPPADYSGFSGVAAGGGIPPPPLPAQKAMCANRVCGHIVASGLCGRCRELLRGDGEGGDSPGGGGGGGEALGALYAAQLQRGCGSVACRNPACPSGAGGARLRSTGVPEREAVRAWLLAQWPTLLLLCVDDRARLEVPVALPAALAPTGAAPTGGRPPPSGRPPPGRGASGGGRSAAGSWF